MSISERERKREGEKEGEKKGVREGVREREIALSDSYFNDVSKMSTVKLSKSEDKIKFYLSLTG
jgi:hypothetical protein